MPHTYLLGSLSHLFIGGHPGSSASGLCIKSLGENVKCNMALLKNEFGSPEGTKHITFNSMQEQRVPGTQSRGAV